MIFQFRNETKQTPWVRWPAVTLRVAKGKPIPTQTPRSEPVSPSGHGHGQPAGPKPNPDTTGTRSGTGREPDSTPATTASDRNPSRNGGEGPRCMETCPALVGWFVKQKAPPPTTITTTPIRNHQHVLTPTRAHVPFTYNYFQHTIIVFLT